ncbi:acyl-ACP desaturase [Streptomyces sp. MMS24-I2-30]|uniref:acyl-ACP desaturase n=1 Tax=Streptomyces sp. MMS24-I2-30 TaxID=3351564 RepID=UPI003896E99A
MTAAPDILAALEPSAERLLKRHLTAAPEWLPHTYIPWSAATDYDGPLDGEPWTAAQSRIGAAVQDALVVNLLTEDNLPSYHFEIATRFGRDRAWGEWVHRWTAEEDRHAHALRCYLHATRAIDPVALERQRMRTMTTGFRSDQPTPLHALAYVLVQELATREAHRNAGAACADRPGRLLMTRIAADENLHMIFYRDLYADALDLAPDHATAALADVICDFRMPGTVIPGFQRRALRIAAAGIYNLDVHVENVLRPLLRTLRVATRTDLGPEGERARDRIGRHLERTKATAERFRTLYQRMEGGGRAAHT